jgi:phosphate transport system protein
MCGLVEWQIACAMDALNTFDIARVEQVIEGARRLNAMEIELDEEVSNIIAGGQPAARDLRLLMATSKCVTNLERAEARKIAKRTRRIAQDNERAKRQHRSNQAFRRNGCTHSSQSAGRIRPD